MSSGPLPVMPRLVALASIAMPSSASSRCVPRHDLDHACPPQSAISCALSARAIGHANLACALRREARHDRARRTAGAQHERSARVSGRHVGSASRRLWMKPLPSLLKPVSVPSGSTTTVFTAPMRRARSSTRSSSGKIACLCGVVTLQPRRPSAPRSAHGGLEPLRRHGKEHVASRDAVVREPVIVDHRRARLERGPAQQARDAE